MKPFKTPSDWLAPIRASHLIQLDTYTDTRNLIHIWLPEGYGKEPHRCSVLDRVEDRRFRIEGDRLITTYRKEDSFELHGELAPIEDGVRMSLSVCNLSAEELPSSSASVCVQLAAAPSFADTKLERFFYVHEDRIEWIRPPYYNLESNHAWFYGTSPNERFRHNPPPDFAFIGLASKDGEWVVGQGWNSGRGIWGNCHPTVSCIHADPHFEAVKLGETVASEGVLYIMRGTPEDCVERFRVEFESRTERT